MKSASAGLIALLNSGQQFMMADLYTISLVGGTTLRYTSADGDIVTGTNLLTYSDSFGSPNWTNVTVSFTQSAAPILGPDGATAATKFTKVAYADTIFLRKVLSHPAGDYTGSIWVYVPSGQSGVTNYKFSNDWGDVDTSAANAQTLTLFDQWIRVSSFGTLAATRSFVDFDCTVNGSVPPAGFYFYACHAQEEPGRIAGNYAATTSAAVAGANFDGESAIIERSRTRIVIGVEVDTLDLKIHALPTHTLQGATLLQALRNGAFDGASVKLERCFMPTWGDTSLGTVILFSGRVADMEVGRFSASIRVNSDLELLNIQMPRNLYQPGCLNTLFDGACTLSKASFGVAGTITGASTTTSLVSGVSNVAGWFDLGTVTFTSGVNAGVSKSVKQYTPGNFTLMSPLVTAPSIGDTFIAYAGCDKQQSTCTNKFSNVVNFRGFPYVPAPESVT